MSNLAQNLDSRPFEIPEPPASERKPRPKKRKTTAAGAIPLHAQAPGGVGVVLGPVAEDIEATHQKRVTTRIERERQELAEQAQGYVEIANEVESYTETGASLADQSTGVVLAVALGAHPGDPLTALLEELRIRCATLRQVARGAAANECVLDQTDVLEMLERELDMMHTRAAVAGELVRRFGGLRDLCNPLRQSLAGGEG